MVNVSVSIAGIEKAVSALDYQNPQGLKCRLLLAIKQRYVDEDALNTLQAILPEELIPSIWETAMDPVAVRSKLKNLNSIRSSVNADLMRSFEQGKNPEGIIISPVNTFIISDAAKDNFIASLSSALGSEGTITIEQIAEISKQFSEFLSKIPGTDAFQFLDTMIDAFGSKQPLPAEKIPEVLNLFGDLLSNIQDHDLLKEREKLKELLRRLSDKADTEQDAPDTEGTPSDDHRADSDTIEVVEVLVEDEEGAGSLEEIDEDELDEEEANSEIDDEAEIEEAEAVDVDEEKSPSDMESPVEIFDPLCDSFSDDLEWDDTLSDQERKNRLAERFNRYLGALERHYNQYLLIPNNEYTIGSNNFDKDELPLQKVRLPDFFFGKFPVTNALFEVFVERTGYKTTAENRGYGIVYQGRFQKRKDEHTGRMQYVWNATHWWEKRQGAFWYQPLGPGSTLHKKRNHPVVQVSLMDAMAFASWVGKRLPIEAEWEAAARSLHGYCFPWGNDWRAGICNIEGSDISDTFPVDSFSDAVNPFGISDLLGNTLEWTAEPCDPRYAANSSQDYYIAKGGSWISDGTIRLYSRFRFPDDYTANILGFRCLAD